MQSNRCYVDDVRWVDNIPMLGDQSLGHDGQESYLLRI